MDGSTIGSSSRSRIVSKDFMVSEGLLRFFVLLQWNGGGCRNQTTIVSLQCVCVLDE